MWVIMGGMSLLLVGAPFSLAFATAYETPVFGISCRSFTFMIHFCMQSGLGFLWIVAEVYRNSKTGQRRMEECDKSALSDFSRVFASFNAMPKPCGLVCYACLLLCGTFSVASAIGGTIMQLMGVYTADICYINTQYWFDAADRSHATAVISQSDQLSIKTASGLWVICGAVGTAFMGSAASLGWWYQKALRLRFKWLVDNIDKTEKNDKLEKIVF